MTRGEVGPTAALAGIPAGVQAQGVWIGRRQLFVRFAAEAETATMYTAAALASEIERAMARSAFHSISISGRDPLGNAEFLRAAFEKNSSLTVMLDSDGQRPDQIKPLRKILTLSQVTIDGSPAAADPLLRVALESIRAGVDCGIGNAVVICVDQGMSDAAILRIVEQTHAVSDEVSVVVHPGAAAGPDRDKRWTMLMERAAAMHSDVRLALRLPPPTGLR